MFRSTGARSLLLAAGVALLAGTGSARQQPLDAGTVMAAVEKLRPGEYLWVAAIAPEGPMLVVVNLATQRLVAYRNGVPIAVSTVSTGRAGHRTPTGVFTVLQKRVHHRSNLYANAPMPYMQRLTWQGIALHGGALPGYPASHGCIRLPHEFARLLFGETELGMTVVVVNRPAGEAVLTGPDDAPARLPQGPAWWRPERAPLGPVSIVVSGADRRMVVLRNGVEIGSAPVAFDGVIDRVQAHVLRDVVGSDYRWERIGLPGQPRAAPPLAAPAASRTARDPFRDALAGVVGPGTTMVVIPDSIGRAAPRAGAPPVTLIEDDPGLAATPVGAHAAAAR